MKITKQRLRQIIKEELNEMEDAMRGAERPGAGIEDIAQPEAEDASSYVAELLDTPEGTLMAKMMAREILDQFASFPELADAIPAIDRDEMTARVVAAIAENPMYAPSLGESSQSGGGSQSKEAKKLDPTAHQWSSKGRKKASSKKSRSTSKQVIKKGDLDEYRSTGTEGPKREAPRPDSSTHGKTNAPRPSSGTSPDRNKSPGSR